MDAPMLMITTMLIIPDIVSMLLFMTMIMMIAMTKAMVMFTTMVMTMSTVVIVTMIMLVIMIMVTMIVAGLTGFPVAVLLVVPNVILSELSDGDFEKTGERREAMFFGVQGFFMKLNLGLSTAALALLYSLFGKDISNSLGVRLTPVVGAVIALVGLVVMTRYPEKRQVR